MAKPTKPIDDELNIYTAVNKIVEIYADSFKFRNDRKAAETSLVKMGAVIQQLITADRKQLLDRVEKEATDINYREAIGDVVGYDKDLEEFDRGYNKAMRTIRLHTAKLRKELGL